MIFMQEKHRLSSEKGRLLICLDVCNMQIRHTNVARTPSVRTLSLLDDDVEDGNNYPKGPYVLFRLGSTPPHPGSSVRRNKSPQVM